MGRPLALLCCQIVKQSAYSMANSHGKALSGRRVEHLTAGSEHLAKQEFKDLPRLCWRGEAAARFCVVQFNDCVREDSQGADATRAKSFSRSRVARMLTIKLEPCSFPSKLEDLKP